MQRSYGYIVNYNTVTWSILHNLHFYFHHLVTRFFLQSHLLLKITTCCMDQNIWVLWFYMSDITVSHSVDRSRSTVLLFLTEGSKWLLCTGKFHLLFIRQKQLEHVRPRAVKMLIYTFPWKKIRIFAAAVCRMHGDEAMYRSVPI